MKAYCVTDGDDLAEVVFAETRSQAKTIPDWWRDIDFIALRATRAPAFDDIQGRVTSRHYIERGWRTPCCCCDVDLDAESFAEYGATYDDDGNAFCSDTHRRRHRHCLPVTLLCRVSQ